MTTRTGHRVWGLLAVLALVVAACTDEAEPAEEEGPTTIPPARTLLRVGVEGWPGCLNPITCDSPQLREQILQHVLPVVFEVTAAGDYRPSPLLSSAPELDTATDVAAMTITYRLEEEAHWEDGRPITSSDIRGTWQAIMATPGADTRGYDLITGIDDRDPLVAVVHLSEPYGDWKELFGGGRGWVLQADSFGSTADLTGRFSDELPFSAAPYRLAAWDEDAAVLTGWDEYWEPSRAPDVDQVRLTRVTVDELAQPESFDVLVPDDPDPGPAPDGFATRTLPTTDVLGVWFDRRTPLLGALAHRQGLAALVDREALLVEVSRTPPAPIECLGWLPNTGAWCAAAAAELPDPDLALATFVLALEGWQTGEAGTLVRGEETFTVPVTFDPAVPGAEVVADEIIASFESVGIRVNRGAVANRTWAGMRPGEQHTGVGVFQYDLGISPQVLRLYGCPDGPSSSVLAWCPEDVVTAARTLVSTVDPGRQVELVEEIGSTAAEDVAWVPIRRQSTTSYVRADRVRVPDPRPALGGPLANLHGFAVVD